MYDIEIIRSRRRTLGITVKRDGSVLVRAPQRMDETDISRFVAQKAAWIEKHQALILARRAAYAPALTQEEIRRLTREAQADLPRRVAQYSAALGITVGRITIRHQKTRWGSCSTNGNVNFNCLLMLCPENVRNYVVVHELCHRREFNHSAHFWALIENVLPDYQKAKQWLKANGHALIARIIA